MPIRRVSNVAVRRHRGTVHSVRISYPDEEDRYMLCRKVRIIELFDDDEPEIIQGYRVTIMDGFNPIFYVTVDADTISNEEVKW